MTENFDQPRNDSEAIILLKERMNEARERDREFGSKLDSILDTLHAMDTKAQLNEHRLNALSVEHGETKGRLDALESDKKNVWLHVVSVLSQIGLWGAKLASPSTAARIPS